MIGATSETLAHEHGSFYATCATWRTDNKLHQWKRGTYL